MLTRMKIQEQALLSGLVFADSKDTIETLSGGHIVIIGLHYMDITAGVTGWLSFIIQKRTTTRWWFCWEDGRNLLLMVPQIR